jgi:hypothetical protein
MRSVRLIDKAATFRIHALRALMSERLLFDIPTKAAYPYVDISVG